MKNVVLYPFTPDNMAIVRFHSRWNKKYRINAVVSPRGLSYGGKDISVADNRKEVGLIVQDDLDKALDENEGLLIPSGDSKAPAYTGIWGIMCAAAKKGKDIICSINLTQRQFVEIRNLCRENKSTFLYCPMEKSRWTTSTITGRYHPSVPVIFVGNLVAEANTLEVALEVANRFMQDGYKVSVIGDRPELNLYGFHGSSLLADLSHGKIIGNDIAMAITLLNHYIHYVESHDNPDVMVIQIPGGMLDTPDFPNECGVYAYILSRVLQPDYFIGCSLLGKARRKEIQFINEEIERRFGYPIDCIHLSNKSVSTESSLQKHKMEFIYYPVEKTYEEIPKMQGEVPVYHLLEKEHLEQMYQNMLEKLSGQQRTINA